MRKPKESDIALLARSELFDATWYAKKHPDVSLSGLHPEQHYLFVGAILLRDPSPGFSTEFYLQDNPDVLNAGMNPLIHYLRFGMSEGRKRLPEGANADSRSKVESVGKKPWISKLRHGAFLDSVLAGGKTNPETITTEQTRLARRAIGDKPPRISVIMPAWNRETVVSRALSSAFEQSLPPAEVILVDDGSEDKTVEVVRRDFAKQISDGVLRIIEADHGGVSAARNHGLAAATSELIAYLDSDNRWHSDYLLFMAAVFAECDTVSTAYCGLSMNDTETGTFDKRGRPWDRQRLIGNNYIDLNVFMHRRALYDQYGGFDTNLSRLVDWDLITRYTRLYEPVYLPLIGVEYFLDKGALGNITRTVPLNENKGALLAKNRTERLRHGLETLRLAYVLWDWPALSQTFVLEEIRWLVRQGHDVKVYYRIEPDRSAVLDFEIEAHHVENPTQLADLLKAHDRNQIHAHFAYPCTTNLAWPAAQKAEIPFTFFAHAVDIFHENNVKRNRIAEVVADPLCQRLFVHGDYHRRFLEPLGVPTSKIAYNFQAVDLNEFGLDEPIRPITPKGPLRGMFIGRFVEKKGLPVLLDAAAQLGPDEVQFDLYGYGRDEDAVREQAARLNLRNVAFHGPLDGRESVVAAMKNVDFLVVPSVVAANGDTEGFPTVILEAMALGLPVVTSDVSSVPDFLDDEITAIVTRQGSASSLSDGIRRLAKMSPPRLAAMQGRAREFLRERIGTPLTMRTYLDTWLDARIEIMLVTYDTPEYRDIEHTREIIRRIREHTTTPYTLSVIDNGSDQQFLNMLREQAAEMPNMRLMELQTNRFCGGATNIALAASDAVYAIYICSKEGFVQRHGWERPLIKSMRENSYADMGGYFCHMPKFTLGEELNGHPAFDKFRNRNFVDKHPRQPFRHVQGGIYILHRDSVDADAGFSYELPQGNTDVEFSYFMESSQRNLVPLDAIASLTVKTRPMLSAVIDEKTSIAHPLTRESAAELSKKMAERNASHCNICDAWNQIDDKGQCASCGSDGVGRKLYQRLAHDWRGFRNGRALVIGSDKALSKALAKPMFDVSGDESGNPFSLIASPRELTPQEIRQMVDRLAPGGLLIWPAANDHGMDDIADQPGLERASTDRCSRLLRSDWRPLQEIARAS
ncbi:glycosyltransferase [Paracoccus aerodenitrificans]|uniref:glycosyltransferase n=1 Tax=Paracoccus aerodenitrificans TaxID=3017781 RepID=UPI0022F05B04|nr:glycosyltransferase [Paracoccus aerodenitrificans]WBU63769.1 glycosyltransferase [Paracoccus aerodenitrificans]